jgi:hypothetical protein
MLTTDQANALMMMQQQQAMALQNSPMGTMPVPMPGPSIYPPQFSYGLPQHERDIFAAPLNMAVNAVPGVLSGIGGAAGLASMVFPHSATLGALGMLDPFSAAFSAGRLGYMGGGLAGAAGGALVGGGAMALGIGALGYGAKSFSAGMGNQAHLAHSLSGFTHANPLAASGRGFSHEGMHHIGTMMQSFADADPFTSMADANKMMDGFLNQGMTQGVQNAKEFVKKFTDYADTLRDMAMTMGKAISDPKLDFLFGQMRGAGFYTAQDVMGNTRSMQAAGSMGMSNDAFLGMQAGGAQITRQQQMTGRAGALTSSRLAQSMLAGAGSLDIFDDTYLMDITGARDLEGATATLGQQYTGALTNFLRNSGTGRAFLATAGTKGENGSFDGGVDSGVIAQIAEGRMGLSGLRNTSQRNLQGRRAQGSFVTQEHNIASSLLEDDRGVDALYSMLEIEARELLGTSSDDNVAIMASKVLQMDKLQAELLVKLMKNRNRIKQETANQLRREQASSAYQTEMARNRSFSGMTQQVIGGVDDWFGGTFGQAGRDAASWAGHQQEHLSDDFWGIQRYAGASGEEQAQFMRGVVTGTSGDLGIRASVRGEGYMPLSTRHALSAMGGDAVSIYGAAITDQLTPEMLAPGGDINLRRSLTETKRREANEIKARMQIAATLGDDDAYAAAREEFKEFAGSLRSNLGSSRMSGAARSAIDRAGTHGNDEQAAAWLAAELGAGKIARDFVVTGKGAESGSYRTMEEIGDELTAAARGAGLSSDQIAALQKGEAGSGASVIAYMGQNDMDRDVFHELMASEEEGTLTERFNRLTGQNFGEDDVEAALRITQDITDRGTRGVFGTAGTADLTLGALTGFNVGMARTASSAEENWKAISGLTAEKRFNAQWLSNQDAVRAEVSMLSSDLKRQLGADDLRTLTTTTDEGAYRSALGGIYDRIAEGSLRGVAGGEGMEAIVKRSQDASSVEDLMSVYGLDMDQLKTWGGNAISGEIDTDEEIQAIQRNLGMNALSAAMSASGGSGGLFTSGTSLESQMMYNMGLTAEKVQKMSEAVDAAFISLEKKGLISSPDEED